jgi:hypothetical protein
MLEQWKKSVKKLCISMEQIYLKADSHLTGQEITQNFSGIRSAIAQSVQRGVVVSTAGILLPAGARN